MNLQNEIKRFDSQSLRKTLIDVRNIDGSISVMDKFGGIVSKQVADVKPEPNFSKYGFIANPNPDLQIGKVKLEDGFVILFGSSDVAQDLNSLKSNGVTHIINLVSNYIPNAFPEHFHYLSLVLYDNLQTRLHDSIYRCLDYLWNVRRQGGCCLIHCDAGVCRAPSMRKRQELSLRQAPMWNVNIS
ncbi:hypothetical protein P879_09870 [Paragonimus westermani]|uniref:Dual specificity phosphatase catalytic domain-containing protein n=1 Tax=Paragonimus westermani TaxID=34504 RepID=A0A8T0DE31_9TREM|nr:hypothetical protein P879_09870 [Paragonimus westermani]